MSNDPKQPEPLKLKKPDEKNELEEVQEDAAKRREEEGGYQ